jgi:exo-1,4-beta-D-glucosaminidase
LKPANVSVLPVQGFSIEPLKGTFCSLLTVAALRERQHPGETPHKVLWDDNYVSLLPGETRTITATYRVRDLGGSPPRLVVTGWNVRRVTAH